VRFHVHLHWGLVPLRVRRSPRLCYCVGRLQLCGQRLLATRRRRERAFIFALLPAAAEEQEHACCDGDRGEATDYSASDRAGVGVSGASGAASLCRGGGGVLKVSSFSRPASLKPPEGARFVAPPLPLWG